MTSLRCLLVDDEPLVLRLLASFVARVPVPALVGTGRNAQEALETLTREPVDVPFLDIRMPDLIGVEFVWPEARVVSTTAYETFAVEDFALGALDYLVKPIAFDRFLQVVQRAQARRHLSQYIGNGLSICESRRSHAAGAAPRHLLSGSLARLRAPPRWRAPIPAHPELATGV